MAEAEDVIVDAARHATAYAAELWRRNRAPATRTAGIELADVRVRLELFVTAILDVGLPVRASTHAPPTPLLARLFDRTRRKRRAQPVPATDGRVLYLPPRIAAQPPEALAVYRAAALQQAARVVRGSLEAYPWAAPAVLQDLFLIAEAAAIERWLTQRLPGLGSGFATARRAALAARTDDAARDPALAAVEALYRRYLASGRIDALADASVADSTAWARAQASALPAGTRYPGLEPDAWLGAVLPPDAAPTPYLSGEAKPTPGSPRTSRIPRRPRARRAAQDEDDERSTSPWMVQSTQPHEHAEDAMGMQRPVDKEPDADMQGAGESIADLESLRLVATPERARESFESDDLLPVRAARSDAHGEGRAGALAYPEWDYVRAGYIERAAIVRPVPTPAGQAQWVDAVLQRQRATLVRVRRRFEALRSRRSLQYGENEGDDIDLQAYVAAYGDRKARLPRPDRLYVSHRPARRDFALLLLTDVSGSTEAWCGGTHRIVDLEKEALIVVASALQALQVRFAIQSFSGYGPRNVRVGELKGFEERFDRAAALRIAALEPDEFTRVGAALRHATATIRREPAYRRLILLLSDGKPNDCDRYQGRYGFEDARQALAEARLQGVAPFCVTVDHHAAQHLAALFGPGNYSVVSTPPQLPAALLEWLRSVTLALA